MLKQVSTMPGINMVSAAQLTHKRHIPFLQNIDWYKHDIGNTAHLQEIHAVFRISTAANNLVKSEYLKKGKFV